MTKATRTLLLTPASLLVVAFLIAIVSLFASTLTGKGLAVYVELLGDPMIWRVLWRTVWISVLTTVLCVILGMPLSLFLARSKHRNVWLILVISPWMVSLVVRTFGWLVLLGTNGALNSLLRSIGILDAPLRILFTPFAVVLGLTHVFLPFMVIAVLSVLLQQDHRLEEAGRILGGSRWQVFRRVTLPLTMGGVYNGASLVLLMATGAIVTPLLLGGLRDRMLGTQIYTEVFQIFDFERATAMAVMLLVVALALVAPLRMMETRLRRSQEYAR